LLKRSGKSARRVVCRNFANTKKTVETPADLKGMKIRTVVVDGFYALQQATFASPKRKSIKAYQDFKSEGDQISATLRKRPNSKRRPNRFTTGLR
jgi:hypothetical protein